MEHQYSKYAFSLDEFQKKSINAIEEGMHVLVCAPTGSGKSLVAQHTVDWGLRQKKRVIYTTPIKSLSNQAYASLAKQFGPDSVGIMTGDNQYNPGAKVLIMTTEILRNFLQDGKTRRHIEVKSETSDSEDEDETQYWYLDVKETVSAVVFDEVHYLQDPHRGHVWETCFVRMPESVSMVMLSATIENPTTLKNWLEKVHPTKPVVLCEHTTRAVPLSHCFYTDLNPTSKSLPDSTPSLSSYKKKLVNVTDWQEPHLTSYLKPMMYHYDWFQRGDVAIQGCVEYLQNNDMIPALCFVLSRKRCESLCASWAVSMLTQDEVSLIHRDWKKLVCQACRGDVSMLQKIESLPQYRLMTESLMKGVAFHHSGVVPIIKECVEMLMKDGRVPCVFATETFAVGINSPTRTVIMSQIDKRTEGGVRCLEPHEYTQMGGRAGRRGLDSVGYVVSLPISFVKKTSALQWYRMVHGNPVHISSTKIIPTHSVLQTLRNVECPLTSEDILNKVVSNSMRAYEIAQMNNGSSTEKPIIQFTEEEQAVWEEYMKLQRRPEKTQGQRKKKQKKMKEWLIGIDQNVWKQVQEKQTIIQEQQEKEAEHHEQQDELRHTLDARLKFLVDSGYVTNEDGRYALKEKGEVTCCFAQGNPLYQGHVACQLSWGSFHISEWDSLSLLQFLSLFRGSCIEAEEDARDISPDTRALFGSTVFRSLEEQTRVWDGSAQRYSCWEPNELYVDMVGPLEDMRELPQSEWSFFTLQKITGWQEGTLWKQINELMASMGEWQEAFGILGQVELYKKCRDAQKICRGLTILIPSLYLQQNSLTQPIQIPQPSHESSETGQESF